MEINKIIKQLNPKKATGPDKTPIKIVKLVANIIDSHSENTIKGAKKLYFTHYSCVVIILFNTGLLKSAFSSDSFGKLVFSLFALFVFSVCSVSNSM